MHGKEWVFLWEDKRHGTKGPLQCPEERGPPELNSRVTEFPANGERLSDSRYSLEAELTILVDGFNAKDKRE